MSVEWPVILAAFLLGLAGAPHCFGMCGGISCAAGALPGGRTAVLVANLYRLVTYGCLGAAAGALLQPLSSLSVLDPWVRAAVGLSMVAAGVIVLRGRGSLELALPFMRTLAGRLQRAGSGSAVLFGIGWGLLPCGMVYGALLMNAAGGAPLASALGMVAFGLGTLPAVGGAGLALRWFASRPALRPLYGTLVVLLGVGTLGHAVSMLPLAGGTGHAHDAHRAAPASDHSHHHPMGALSVRPATATGDADAAALRPAVIDAGQRRPARGFHNPTETQQSSVLPAGSPAAAPMPACRAGTPPAARVGADASYGRPGPLDNEYTRRPT